MELDDIRREYLAGGLNESNLDSNPFNQFDKWMNQAIESKLIKDPTAMCVATVDAHGQPSQRIVLLKQFDEKGFVFYTNLGSRKAEEIAGNSQVSIHFPWLALDRQVIVYGQAQKLSTMEVAKYFASRPKDSQLGAWASHQSQKIDSRSLLEQAFSQVKTKFKQGKIPVPDFWGGYRVVPHKMEFWQGGAARLHDRFLFEKQGEDWTYNRLQP